MCIEFERPDRKCYLCGGFIWDAFKHDSIEECIKHVSVEINRLMGVLEELKRRKEINEG